MNLTKTLLKVSLFSAAAVGVVAVIGAPITTGVLAAVVAGAAIGTVATEMSTPPDKPEAAKHGNHEKHQAQVAEPEPEIDEHAYAQEHDIEIPQVGSRRWQQSSGAQRRGFER